MTMTERLSTICSRGLKPAFRDAEILHFVWPERALKPATTYLVQLFLPGLRCRVLSNDRNRN